MPIVANFAIRQEVAAGTTMPADLLAHCVDLLALGSGARINPNNGTGRELASI
jgi:hypothetical protein